MKKIIESDEHAGAEVLFKHFFTFFLHFTIRTCLKTYANSTNLQILQSSLTLNFESGTSSFALASSSFRFLAISCSCSFFHSSSFRFSCSSRRRRSSCSFLRASSASCNKHSHVACPTDAAVFVRSHARTPT